MKCTYTYQIHMVVIHDYPHAFQDKSSQRGGITTSFAVESLADKSIQHSGPIFPCARLKNWLCRHCQSRAADIKAITETSLMWFSRRAEQPLRCISVTSVTLACFARARLKFIVSELKRTKAEKKKKEKEKNRKKKTIVKDQWSLRYEGQNIDRNVHFERCIMWLAYLVPFRRFSSMYTREGVRPVRLSRFLFELS